MGIKCNGLLDSVNIRMTLPQLLLHDALCIKLVFFCFFLLACFSFSHKSFQLQLSLKKLESTSIQRNG